MRGCERTFDVRPEAPVQDTPDSGCTDTEPAGKPPESFTMSASFANLAYFVGVQFCASLLTSRDPFRVATRAATVARSHTPFSGSICHVFRMCSFKEMTRVSAGWIVAVVANLLLWRKRAVRQFPRHAVNQTLATTYHDRAVAAHIAMAGPFPTGAKFWVPKRQRPILVEAIPQCFGIVRQRVRAPMRRVTGVATELVPCAASMRDRYATLETWCSYDAGGSAVAAQAGFGTEVARLQFARCSADCDAARGAGQRDRITSHREPHSLGVTPQAVRAALGHLCAYSVHEHGGK